jgi:phosphate/sulfate permease
MKIRILSIFSLFVFAFSLCAQTGSSTTSNLKSSDVENFIKHYKSIEADFEALDYDIDPATDDVESLLEEMGEYSQVNTIVKKYGYTDYADFAIKIWAITSCYTTLKLNGEGGMSQIDAAIQEIEEDENMSPEEKEMAVAQIRMIMKAMGSSFASGANEQDIETVKPYISKLDAIYDEQ